MTEEKAIDLLDNLLGMIEDNQGNDYDTALKMGIQALKERESMLYTDDDIHEYKHETVDNVKWHDEMTQDEINLITDAVDRAITTHEHDVNFFQLALIKTLERILSEIESKWKEASPDEAVGYFDSMKIIKGYLDKAKEIQKINKGV